MTDKKYLGVSCSSRPIPDETPVDPLKVITVRLPRSQWAALKEEAYQGRVSLNGLCVRKLGIIKNPE